jgi:hypothetical protein
MKILFLSNLGIRELKIRLMSHFRPSFHYSIIDGIVKSRHSRENGNPENSNYMKILDSRLRRNDRQWPFQTFYETIIIPIFRFWS